MFWMVLPPPLPPRGLVATTATTEDEVVEVDEEDDDDDPDGRGAGTGMATDVVVEVDVVEVDDDDGEAVPSTFTTGTTNDMGGCALEVTCAIDDSGATKEVDDGRWVVAVEDKDDGV